MAADDLSTTSSAAEPIPALAERLGHWLVHSGPGPHACGRPGGDCPILGLLPAHLRLLWPPRGDHRQEDRAGWQPHQGALPPTSFDLQNHEVAEVSLVR
eukprot:4719139-Alexandrium_andersonii.AAC.1